MLRAPPWRLLFSPYRVPIGYLQRLGAGGYGFRSLRSSLSAGELQLLALDNMIVVYHAALDSILLFDVQRSPICAADGVGEGAAPGAPGGPPGPAHLRGKDKAVPAKADPSKGVRSLPPLVRGTALCMHPAAPFLNESGRGGREDEGEKTKGKQPQMSPDGLTDVDLQATNLGALPPERKQRERETERQTDRERHRERER